MERRNPRPPPPSTKTVCEGQLEDLRQWEQRNPGVLTAALAPLFPGDDIQISAEAALLLRPDSGTVEMCVGTTAAALGLIMAGKDPLVLQPSGLLAPNHVAVFPYFGCLLVQGPATLAVCGCFDRCATMCSRKLPQRCCWRYPRPLSTLFLFLFPPSLSMCCTVMSHTATSWPLTWPLGFCSWAEAAPRCAAPNPPSLRCGRRCSPAIPMAFQITATISR